MSLNLHDFHVSETHGFLLDKPLATLPPYFESWNRIARSMPLLVMDNMMRQEVAEMPLIDHNQLSGYRQKRLAHLQLTIIAAGYVWQNGDKGASKSIPSCLAIPLYGLSQDLQLPPVLNHPGLALANWAPIDSERPLTLDNICSLYKLPGGEESEWFCVVTVMMEYTFAKCIKPIQSVLKGMEDEDETLMATNLNLITETMKEMEEMFSHMHDKLSSDTFFNIVRPFLGGWGGENNPLPEGLLYEGVSEEPIKVLGGSAAQSTTLQALDALLGVQHSADKKSFLTTMRTYMPPSHKCFVEALENQPRSLRNLVCRSGNPNLQMSYNNCLLAVTKFRSYHIQIVTKYIVSASTKQSEDKRFESLDKKGTGGTSLLPFLKDLRQDTKDCLL